MLNYIGLVYALIFGVTIFGEHYTAQTVLGISLVVAGVLLAVLYGKPKPPEVIEETETRLSDCSRSALDSTKRPKESHSLEGQTLATNKNVARPMPSEAILPRMGHL